MIAGISGASNARQFSREEELLPGWQQLTTLPEIEPKVRQLMIDVFVAELTRDLAALAELADGPMLDYAADMRDAALFMSWPPFGAPNGQPCFYTLEAALMLNLRRDHSARDLAAMSSHQALTAILETPILNQDFVSVAKALMPAATYDVLITRWTYFGDRDEIRATAAKLYDDHVRSVLWYSNRLVVALNLDGDSSNQISPVALEEDTGWRFAESGIFGKLRQVYAMIYPPISMSKKKQELYRIDPARYYLEEIVEHLGRVWRSPVNEELMRPLMAADPEYRYRTCERVCASWDWLASNIPATCNVFKSKRPGK